MTQDTSLIDSDLDFGLGVGLCPSLTLDCGSDHSRVQSLGKRLSRDIIDSHNENICKIFSNVKSEIKYNSKSKAKTKGKTKSRDRDRAKRVKGKCGARLWLS
jgi:hypothetical protein